MMQRRILSPWPQFAVRKQHRPPLTPETVAIQELRWVCQDAWHSEQPFLSRLAASARDLYSTPWEGPSTGLYVVMDDHAAKFGISDDVFKRAEALQHATYRKLILYAAVPATATIERWLHVELNAYRFRGEWFALEPPVLAVADTLLGIAEMCSEMDENNCGPASAIDSLVMLMDDLQVAA